MTGLAWLVTIWAWVAAGFSAVTAWRVVRRARQPLAPHGKLAAPPRLVLFRPVDDPTAAELEALSAAIDYRGELDQIVLSPNRPAISGKARWLPSDPTLANRKVGHLLNGLSSTSHDGRWVVSIDADVRVTGELLEALVAPLLDGASLCTAAPEPQPGPTWGARATRALLVLTHHSFFALDVVRAGAAAVCGKAMALGPLALAELGALGDRVGEDLELALRLERAGGQVRLASSPAIVPQPGPVPFAGVLQRFTRWMLVLKSHRPKLYPTVPLLFAPSLPLLALAIVSANQVALAAVALEWLSRAGLSKALSRQVRSPQRWTALEWLLGEALLLAAFASSLPAQPLSWRGRTFELGTGGRLRLPPGVEP